MRKTVLLALLSLALTGCAGSRGRTPQTLAVRPSPAPVVVTISPSDLSLIRPRSALFEATRQTPDRIALTFDAGADAAAVPLLLTTLAAHHARATFFLTGKFCEKFPRQCRAIADAGMEIGNHSYSHPHFRKLNRTAILKQLGRAEAAILKVCGHGAKPLFRFPYGDCDERTQKIVAEAGYQAVGWTIDSLDSVGKQKSKAFVANRILKRMKPGYITLMHVSQVHSAQSLEAIFARLERDGVQQVPVSRLLIASNRERERIRALRMADAAKRTFSQRADFRNLQKAKETLPRISARSYETPLPSRSARASHGSLSHRLRRQRRLVTAGRLILPLRSHG